MKTYECIIVWAWAAWIGVALKLQEAWVDCLALEWDEIWSSFKKWNSETRFISPSFPGNAFGQVDLNSIHHETSPGLMLRKEHISGKEYAQYLEKVVEKYDVDIVEGVKVTWLRKENDIFTLQAVWGIEYSCQYLISAIGEFGRPSNGEITGAEHALHSSKILDYESYTSENKVIPIIGGYESSVDAAWGLYKKWRKSHIFCPHEMDEITTSDPSQILSLYSLERLREMREHNAVDFSRDYIVEIQKENNKYVLIGEKRERYNFSETPILAIWFKTDLPFLWESVSYRSDGFPKLTDTDELKKTKKIFVVGPHVRQGELIFCFVYKYRLRFWVVALEIAKRLWKDINYYALQESWEKQGFYLDHLTACWDECVC